MSGLNFLLWTIAVILILGVVIFVIISIYAYRVRNRAIEKFKSEPTIWDKLKEAQAEQEALLKKHNKK
ncbi:hypothetical protein [Xylanibacter muris]|uniref:hypothetical protein n=1 Tax=Xylanibacter muris TaxID=2736290 RepID=UPI0025A03308|nr:hypothetical protein [Xylanibacter muris]